MVDHLYLHIPFCASRCRYCDFATAQIRRGDGLMGAYVEGLCRVLADARRMGLLGVPRTAYVGGGTPSLLGAEALSALVDEVCSWGAVDELSFEANPESLTDDVLDRARAAGATRVSIGVQSFHNRELRALGRIHSAEVARERVGAAVASGLDVSLDLMCGVPYQTEDSWHASLEAALELGVGHVSCYPLAIEEGTALERLCEQGKLPWPDDDAEAGFMQAAAEALGARGFTRYEVASYALPGKRCKHNIAYWTGREYLGLGVAAASMLGRASYEVLREAVPGLPAAGEGAERFRLTVTSDARVVAAARGLADLSFDVEQMCAREAAAEDLMLGMRMGDGVAEGGEVYSRAMDAIPEGLLQGAIDRAVGSGLARWTEGEFGPRRLVPTERGWLMGNELYGLIWDLARDE